MKNTQRLIEELVEKLEAYGKTNLELAKLKALRTASIVASEVVTKTIILVVMSMFLIILNIGISLWVGKFMGEYYYGFFIVAAAYLFIGMLLAIFAPQLLHRPIRRYIIREILKY